MKTHLLLLLVTVATSSNIGNNRQDINLSSDGGYTNILVAIDDSLPDNPDIISKLQRYFTEASEVLLKATNNRLYFKNFTIVVPETWTYQSSWLEPTKEQTVKRARVVVADANAAYGNEPYTRQPGACGQEGDFIHFTPEYFLDKPKEAKKYRPAKRIVKEFAKLKWGLFDENIPVNDTTASRFYMKDGAIQIQGCVENLSFLIKDPTKCTLNQIPPPPPCDFVLGKVDGSASLLAYEYDESVTSFCSDNKKGSTHNSLSNNRQNSNCHGRSAWSVMSDLEDFATDFGQTRSLSPPDPTFQIVQKRTITTSTSSTSKIPTTTASLKYSTTSAKTSTRPSQIEISTASSSATGGKPTSPTGTTSCTQDVVCICLDVSGSMSTSNRITTMSEAVQLYILSYLRRGTAVGIVSFSSSAFLNMDMTVVNDEAARERLREAVPTTIRGSTNIFAGINKCRQILTTYTGGDITNTRIILHSDGDGHVGDSIKDIVSEGVILDTVLFGQGGYLAAQASQTGGKEYLVSDGQGEQGLLDFYEETASRFCEAKDTDALLNSDVIIIPAGEQSYKGRVYFDVTTGLNTKMVFKYTKPVNITVSTDLRVNFSEDACLRTMIILIEGQLTQYVDYTITKKDVGVDVSVNVKVTSSPTPNVQPIEVTNRLNSRKITFSKDTELVGYIEIFQGYSPVLQLNVSTILEDPTGALTRILYHDDGTGKDSVPNDGIYTGFLPSHLIGGDKSNSYYGLSIDISGEGVLPNQGNIGTRRKRCVSCDSLGNVTRTGSGGVIVIENWIRVPDTTPPQMITDLTTVEASKDSGLVLLSWTAPGEDLNIGKASGYEFGVGADLSVDAMVSLEPEAILTNVSTFLVEAGTVLQMHVNASAINLTVNEKSISDGRNETFYFRIRTNDSSNNFANWSNPASASFVDPETMAILLRPATTTPRRVTTEPSTTSTESTTEVLMLSSTTQSDTTTQELSTTSFSTTEIPTVKPPLTIIAVSVGAAAFFGFVVALGMYICHVQSKKSRSKKRRSDHDGNENIPMSHQQPRPNQVRPHDLDVTRNPGGHVRGNLERIYSRGHPRQHYHGSAEPEFYHKGRQPPVYMYDNPVYA